MKRLIYLLVFSAGILCARAQDVRTPPTRIADALALLPAKDSATAHFAYVELMALDDASLAAVFEGVRPSGDLTGVPYRYAVALLATRASLKSDRERVEGALVTAISMDLQPEVRQYHVQYLGLVGSNRSVPALVSLLNDEDLADPAIGALQEIATPDAISVLENSLRNKPVKTQVRIVQALSSLNHRPSVSLIIPLASSPDVPLKRESLWALAILGDSAAEKTLLAQAAAAKFKSSPAQEMEALVKYMSVVKGRTADISQRQYRIAALKNLVQSEPATSQPALAAELDRFDATYRLEVLQVATVGAGIPEVREAWMKLYKKSKEKRQAEILDMLATANRDETFVNQVVVPAVDSKNAEVRLVAIRSLAATRKSNYADRLATFLLKPALPAGERSAGEIAFLQLAEPAQVRSLAKSLLTAKPEVSGSILRIVSERREALDPAVIEAIGSWTHSSRPAVYAALPRIVSPAAVTVLLKLLTQVTAPTEVTAVQQALIAIAGPQTAGALLEAATAQRAKLLPVLPYLNDPQSLKTVKASFEQGDREEKDLAFSALANWQTAEAIPYLLSLVRDKSAANYRAGAYSAFVKQVMNTTWPSDQKLLMLREVFALAASAEERRLALREAGGVRTFLSFVFAASWLDDPDLGAAASRAVMRLALPTADGQPGLTGQEVRRALEKVMTKLTGPDSQYDRIDVQNYLDQLPFTQGFEPLFNGKDLAGWQGLVENPIARARMTKEELATKQAMADARLSESWSVKDGMICFTGKGDNLCTKRIFGDFEMVVDYRIPRNGDSGIYLRGSPQVQIWDPMRVDAGANLGSGGLYNNTVNRDPLTLADNPIGDWNTLRITMIGDRVTVYLNGLLVVDNVVMENYWDRKLPIFSDGPIELQSHGTELAFRDIYVREINKPYELTPGEKTEGYQVLFNGNDLSGWVGNKTDYVVDDHVIAIYPTGRGKGNLYTEKEYSNFVFRFEFQLTPAGNNGLGIHAPLEGDAAYVGKEIQILDDGHPSYANIQPYQAHGSVYGIVPAKRGFLRPTGEWNSEEVEVRGDHVKVTLNGTVIVDADLKKATAKGTLDKQIHPGLKRHQGHIGFLGHGSVVKFRHIRIRTLAPVKR
jgi:hypothetical protein